MNKYLKHFAIVINLENPILAEVENSWHVLQEFGMQFISSRSKMPHIALVSSHIDDAQLLSKKMVDIVNVINCFDIKSNGLGVFVRKTPVIYLRWYLNQELYNLYNKMAQLLKNQGDMLTDSTQADQWLPKTTLAFHDTNYNKLELILKKLNRFNYEQTMSVKSLSLLELTTERESELEKYNLSRF